MEGAGRKDESLPSEIPPVEEAKEDNDSIPGAASVPTLIHMKTDGGGREEEEEEGVSPVGSYVGKEADGATGGVLLGKVASYDAAAKVYSVVYEDGEREDLDPNQLSKILMPEDAGGASRLKMSCRKRKLDLLLSSASSSADDPKDNNNDDGPDLSEDAADSSSNSCESARQDQPPSVVETKVPELPPSSGDIAVPEDSVSHLFSVYGFLRSFSVQLFLSPFSLDDFVASLNSAAHNSLVDAIHLALLKALRRHLQSLSSDGSQLASQCLRYQDWSLLDSLTWPAFLLEYLYVMGYIKQLGGQRFGVTLFMNEYYQLPVSTKLRVLQILCDEVIDSVELKMDLENRESYQEEIEYDAEAGKSIPTETSGRRGRPRKNPPQEPPPASSSVEQTALVVAKEKGESLGVGQDGNSDDCRICGMDGMLICCDGCPWAYHSRCIGLNKGSLPEGLWFCPECSINKLGPKSSRIERGARGATIFGVDVSGRMFLATCNYLLVIGTTADGEAYHRYYNKEDAASVFHILSSADDSITAAYADISRGISEYWDIKPLPDSKSNPSLINNAQGESSTPSLAVKKEVTGEHVMSGLAAYGAYTPSPITQGGGYISQQQLAYANGYSNGEKYKVVTSGKNAMKAQGMFKPWAYQNQYTQGDIAATAAATLAVLSSEESSNSKASDASNPRKLVHVNTLLQMKAFASATLHFVWPSADRKQMEVPRERCGWCIACRGATVNKKGCLLNTAATNSIKASARNLSGLRDLRPVIHRNEESHLLSIATYIINMHETLQGLMIGPLLDPEYKQWWLNQLRQANNVWVLKFLLLDLEKSIRGVAFLGGWFKQIDDWLVDITGMGTGGASRLGGSQKRGGSGSGGGGGGRRNRKRSLASDSAAGGMHSDKSWKEVQWWRGGKLSSSILRKWALVPSLTRKAARQGGLKKIGGVSYPESFDFPRRNRQFVWRASVHFCKNISHLALQVRYMNAYIRWRDLVPPDQIPIEGKAAAEADASAFRNAVICDKRLLENKTIYALKFPNQKHLPVRVTKNILEAENSEDENGKLWFSENHIPLYLIKIFEEKAGTKTQLPAPATTPPATPLIPKCLSKPKRRVHAYYTNVFMYLSDKCQRPIKSPCASCKFDVLLRDVVRCRSCQGDCHEECIALFGGEKGDESVVSSNTCKSCQTKHTTTQLLPNYKMIPAINVSPHEIKKMEGVAGVAGSATKIKFLVGGLPPQTTTTTLQPATNNINNNNKVQSSASKSAGGLKRKKPPQQGDEPVYYGLRYKRKKSDDGLDFRMEHIVLKCKGGMRPSKRPQCSVCKKPYDPNLMYIRCEKCLSWFHAEAVQLEESRVCDLLGFKCGKCRRKTTPKCPYVDGKIKKPEPQLSTNNQDLDLMTLSSFHDNTNTNNDDSSSNNMSKWEEVPLPQMFSSEEDLATLEEDPLLSSSGRVEPISAPTFEANNTMVQPDTMAASPLPRSYQKLSVRRANPKQTVLASGTPSNNNEMNGFFFPSEDANYMSGASWEVPTPVPQWDFSQGDGYVGGNGIEPAAPAAGRAANFDNDSEFEPQTYFSFTELLASEDSYLDAQCGLSLTNTNTNTNNNKDVMVEEGLVLDGVASACHKCKLQDPSPDLKCEMCGLCIHTHCSPWEECRESFVDNHWRCGNCRDWR